MTLHDYRRHNYTGDYVYNTILSTEKTFLLNFLEIHRWSNSPHRTNTEGLYEDIYTTRVTLSNRDNLRFIEIDTDVGNRTHYFLTANVVLLIDIGHQETCTKHVLNMYQTCTFLRLVKNKNLCLKRDRKRHMSNIIFHNL